MIQELGCRTFYQCSSLHILPPLQPRRKHLVQVLCRRSWRLAWQIFLIIFRCYSISWAWSVGGLVLIAWKFNEIFHYQGYDKKYWLTKDQWHKNWKQSYWGHLSHHQTIGSCFYSILMFKYFLSLFKYFQRSKVVVYLVQEVQGQLWRTRIKG